MKIALLCGGPSLERGISLNSTRSVLDHLSDENIEIVPIYFDAQKNAYHISQAQLYSNTPSDFDFKLKQTAAPLNKNALIKLLKSVDLAFPVMHGPFGEDGKIQAFLEKNRIPFVGSGSNACKQAFDKYISNELIKSYGFFTLPSKVLKIYHEDHADIIQQFFKEHQVERAVVKPASGGSSIGVFSVTTPEDALESTQHLFSKRMDTRVVIEPFAKGTEFTIIILENRFGLPVALPPTEIETDYTENQIFDFRKKYLPTRQVIWHCPPRFSDEVIEKIEAQAEQLFSLFNMHDFARFDGWVLPDGNIWFCDFNPISGMEQNSFLFQQASRVGMTHRDMLHHVINSACRRYGLPLMTNKIVETTTAKKRIPVLFGGNTSERQVSLMSGTNVWLKLRNSKKYSPQPYLLDPQGNVWQLPYHLALNHTVEEIIENCKQAELAKKRLDSFEKRVRIRLGLLTKKNPEDFFDPKKMSLQQLIEESDFIFNALHGGEGENGTLQAIFERANVQFNGSNEQVSALCADKWATSNFIKQLNIEGVDSIPGQAMKTKKLFKLSDDEITQTWKNLRKELNAETLIAKPRSDGCSTGVVHLYSSNDLKKHLALLEAKATFVPKNTFKNQPDVIELPQKTPDELLFERFIETDVLKVKNLQLKHLSKTGWIELTVGVLENQGKVISLNPSITVAEGEVLTVEEKFQGGTGINITPPPASIIKPEILEKIKQKIATVASKLNIQGYARIDTFANIHTGQLYIIEVNTLPGLTASTVFYHQALAENPAVFPGELLEKLIHDF